MIDIIDYIKENKMVKAGDVVGVGVSGGIDSMCLLHYLNSIKDKLDIEVVGIHINHGIREESAEEARFVTNKCKEWGVRVYTFKIDSNKIARDKKLSVETAAREGRYGIFDAIIKKDIVDKIALAHHQSDQAETILMHIFRGAGSAGARGMEPVHNGIYIRPFLETLKEDINQYAVINDIEYVEDSSNADTSYNRNFMRHVIMPEILKRWPNAIEAINNFSRSVVDDDDYITRTLDLNSLVVDSRHVQMPCNIFKLHPAVYSRIIFKALSLLGVKKDIERKHLEMIKELAMRADSGKKIKLPLDVTVYKEYGFITFENCGTEKTELRKANRCMSFDVEGFGNVTINRVRTSVPREEGVLYFDYRKVPKEAVWRFREDGDVFEKFGGGTKKLKSYLNDKKIPARKRDFIPVLAVGNQVLVIAGVEISEKVKIDSDVPTCFAVKTEIK